MRVKNVSLSEMDRPEKRSEKVIGKIQKILVILIYMIR